jgi:hypothetical protein
MYRSLFLILVLVFPLNAFADDPPPPPDMKKFELDGKIYVGFLEKDAQVLLQYRIDIPKLRKDIIKHKDLLQVKELQMDKLTSANLTLLDTKHFLITENVRLQQTLDSRDAWYRSPYFWFGVGLALGTAATVTVVYVIK